MVAVEGAPGRSQEALFHSFTQQTLSEARGATSGKVALTLIMGVGSLDPVCPGQTPLLFQAQMGSNQWSFR